MRLWTVVLGLLLAAAATAPISQAQTSNQRRNTLAFLQEFRREFPVLDRQWVGNDYCQWPLVSCAPGTGEVTLSLAGAGLIGRMPELDDDDVDGREVMIVSIDMSNNPGLSGEFEDDWDELKRLRSLDLSYTSLRGELPDDWRDMTALETVKITNTYACKNLPEWRQPSLRSIDLSNNPNMQGSLKDDWARIPQLQYVNLDGTNFCGCMPHEWHRNPVLVQAAARAKPALVAADCRYANQCTDANKRCGSIPPPGPSNPSSSSGGGGGGEVTSVQPPSSSSGPGPSSTSAPAPTSTTSTAAPPSTVDPTANPNPDPIAPPRDWANTRRFLRKLAAQFPVLRQAWFPNTDALNAEVVIDDEAAFDGLCHWQGVSCVYSDDSVGHTAPNAAVYPVGLHIRVDDGSFSPQEVSGFLPDLSDPPYDDREQRSVSGMDGSEVYVYQLILSDCPLVRGRLPRTWGLLTELRTLSLKGTSVMGTIPVEWSGMDAIRVLDLSETNLCGSLPAWGGTTSRDTHARLRGSMTATMQARAAANAPVDCSTVDAAPAVAACDASLTGTHADHIGGAAKDEEAQALRRSGARATVPYLFPKLEYLDVSDNPFMVGSLPPEWANLVTPQHVNLFNLTACGCVPPSWQSIPALVAAVDQLANAASVKACLPTQACSRVKYAPHCDM